MDTNNIENVIIKKIEKKIESKQNLSDEDIDSIIISEITSAKYLKEDWQIHYAKERIKKIITEEQLEKLPKEQRANFGHPGWYFIACVFIGNLTQYTKNYLLFIAGSFD
ncbi:MAG: hypothetical protein UX10_C0017G0002 [Candidatus Magasanikbacteria bacterium GW2011_GWA2_45_39]|uniref:Uncharacterized protein n=2 Tax=Candidatus Magasanikiibacteriota TaxID=1752731 RepID=A0A0G1Q7R9_9BACT|nr:MAG: hypothetical protein UX10_C0017G0002 [Candidatus Magasanikbacteria bacterium GW2011_GWA2_45_39]KKU13778.1 MAG: hypothetical protein UX20_C0013G0002 [Candidatus Magasanikbacteria bacterium GW2011_GWC2_45_8]HBW74302.1 hypothetical protein [Candidatus Magasanikbacteria bacterium]